jgi:hypothetical protein
MTLFLEELDLSLLYLAVSIGGALLAIYAMQFVSCGIIGQGDTIPMRHIRRAALAILALALLWSVSYGETRRWQPWPPELFVRLAVDLYLLMSVITAHRRCPWGQFGSRSSR